MRFGYTLMTEQSGPRRPVEYAVAAEQTAKRCWRSFTPLWDDPSD